VQNLYPKEIAGFGTIHPHRATERQKTSEIEATEILSYRTGMQLPIRCFPDSKGHFVSRCNRHH
jgi:hypothetical protein